MGGFVKFACGSCGYEEPEIPIGHGRQEMPYLALFRCDGCKTIGSTWVHADKVPRCANCYHDAVTLVPDGARRVNCPKCGEPARITPREGSWE